ncbi:MAG: flavodoxin [Rhodospirillaceae bacterium]|nr:flavodoxin [Rhodospirillaceae bacterium]|tara:strand:- start:5184 stop:5651 length:468 start_codon:yes stop_codon:yes gene_type:complete
MSKKLLLIVAHTPSENTRILLKAITDGARSTGRDFVDIQAQGPFETMPDHVNRADAIILGTTENLGYMSGALKDFFDRIYYPCLEEKQGLPYCLFVRAGQDGTGTCRAVETITTGLRWRAVQAPLVCRGPWQPEFKEQCEELGSAMAAGLDLGVF